LVGSLVLTFFNFHVVTVQASPDTAWLSGWGYRKSHVIGPASGAGANYQIRVKVNYGSGADSGENVYLAGKCRTDFGDIRFTDYDGSTLLDYWMESKVNSNNAVFWVEVADDLSSNQSIYLSYGRSDAATTSNVTNTFVRVINGAQPVKLALPLVEGAGTIVYDKSGNGNNGTIYGASWVDGKYGKALSFNGSTDYVRVPDAGSLDVSEITISVWTKRISSEGSFDSICGKDWTNRIFLTGNRIIGLLIDANANEAYLRDTEDMQLNEWYHIVVTYSVAEDAVKLYVNNVLKVFSNALNTTLEVNAADLYIGMRASGDHPYSGIIDEFHVYNRALTAGEISDLYNNYGYSTTNYAGGVLVRRFVSPEPLHGVWGSEETEEGIGGWLSGWGYRESHVIGSASGAGANYQIRVKVNYGSGADSGENVYLAGKCRTDFGDIRFTDYDGSTLLDYWLEAKVDGNYAVLWVEVADDLSSQAQAIYVYYGRSDAATTSNVTNTFVRVINGAQPVKLALPMDEGSGTITYDKSGNGNNGTLLPVGSEPTWVDGKYGKALSFDGVDDYVEVPRSTSLNNTEGLTIVVWIKPQAAQIDSNIVVRMAGGHSYGLFYSEGYWYLYLTTSETPWTASFVSSPLTLNEWVFLAVTYDNIDTANFYKNGVLVKTDTTTWSGTVVNVETPVRVGRSGWGGDPDIKIIDEVCIYNRALTAGEVSDLYNNYGYSTTNYAGGVLVRRFVSPEPAHGAWGSEETEEGIGGWLSGWGYRKSHVIGSAAGAGANYQVKLTVYYGSGTDSQGNVYLNGKCRSDFGDIRFTDYDGSTLLDYWIENSGIDESQTTKSDPVYVNSNGTAYVGGNNTLYKSEDSGQTWQALKTVTNAGVTVAFIASNGYVYFTAYGNSVAPEDRGLWRAVNDKAFTRVQELPVGYSILLAGFDEDSEGRLFFGVYTYSGATNASIYRSTNNGATWNSVYYDSDACHVHNVQVDKLNNYVYATVGDNFDPWNTEYILRSTDNGGNWSQVLSGMIQCLSICVVPNARFFGSDDAGVTGRIYRTVDDSSFSTVLDVGQSAYCWWIKRDSLTGKIYASFVSTEENPTFARIYVSEDDGENWTVYKTLSASQPFDGSLGASNFVNGTMYYFLVENGDWKNNVRLNRTDYAVFWVEVADDLSSQAQAIYVYYGRSDAATISNVENTFVRVINGAQPVKLALPMNENPDNVTYDRSGKSNHGFISNASWVDGKYGKALSFNGSTDYVRVPDAGSLDVSEITISVWTKRISSEGSFDSICGKDWTNRIFLTGNRIIGLLIDANANEAYLRDTEDMQLNEWYHIVVTYSVAEDAVKLYVNNVLKVFSNALNTTLEVNAADLYIGMRASGDHPYSGIIDEFHVYNRALTAGEISDLYNNYGYSTTNYAGGVLVRRFVSPEPAHGAWGSEERGEYVIIDKAFVSDERADVGSVQTVGFHAKWNNNGSDVVGGSIYVNGTNYVTNNTGWINVRAVARREAPDNFTIIALPDTQFYSASHPEIFDSQTQWVVNNAQSMDIVFVTHEGDIVNDYSSLSQWNNANNSMSKLDAGNVSYGVLPGNHDGSPLYLSNFNKLFNYSRFNGESWYGGAYQNENANNFELFHGGQDDYLIFHFQYDPSDQVLTWANSTLQNYPNRRVIVTTHSYLNVDGSRTDIGNRIWQNFVAPHADQIFLVLCGHNNGETQRTDIINGHTVYQIMADYQDRTNGGNGWLRTLEFHPVEDKIYVRTYSPHLNNYETDADSQFTLDYNVTWVASSIVEKVEWIVTGVNCSGVTIYTQTTQIPSIVWDQIKIIEGGTTKESLTLGETATLWFKAIYEYDNTVFTNANGILYLNGSAMTWSATNTRWEYIYTATAMGTVTFTISGVYDESHDLTMINDTIGVQTINVWSTPLSVISNSTISELTFNSTSKTVTFTVSGTTGTRFG